MGGTNDARPEDLNDEINLSHPDRIKPPPTPKQKQVSALNIISDQIQEIYFSLEDFNGLDAGNVCRSHLLDALDGVNGIRRKLLSTEKNITDDKD